MLGARYQHCEDIDINEQVNDRGGCHLRLYSDSNSDDSDI